MLRFLRNHSDTRDVMNSWMGGMRGERRTCAQNKTLCYTNECKDEMNTEQTSCQEVSLQLNASLSSFFPMHYEEVKHHLLCEPSDTHSVQCICMSGLTDWEGRERASQSMQNQTEAFTFYSNARHDAPLSMARQCIYLYLSFPFSLSSLTWTSWCNHIWTTQSMKK